jgi:hypothetical protein
MTMKLKLLCLCFALAAGPASTDTRVWLLGGGHTLDNSQAQIEANVRWLEDLLAERRVPVRTYFGLGHAPGADVAYFAPDAQPDHEQAFARIFGDFRTVGVRYRPHALRFVVGGTTRQPLIEALEKDFSALGPNDELLLVYNGHGGIDRRDTRRNYLKTWGDERLTVSAVEALLDHVPRGVPTRFVMTQCYSGAFHALIYDDPENEEGFRSERCGFMAESATRLAEGCQLSVDQSEFRDYTTYFFAALSGRTRLGEPLPMTELDRDGDGVVSFREAHFHALVAAHSADLSRSTSEQFLESWSPWFLRWESLQDSPQSVYWSLADEIADRYGWDAQPKSLERVRRQLAAEAARYEHERGIVRRQVTALRETLAAELVARHRELGENLSAETFARLWPHIRAELAADSRYEELQSLQQTLRGLGSESLERTRTLTQIEKIVRLRQLARLERALETYGSAAERRQYTELLQCEAGSLRSSAP